MRENVHTQGKTGPISRPRHVNVALPAGTSGSAALPGHEMGARIPLTGVQRRPSRYPSNGAPPPHHDAAGDSRQAGRRFVRGEGAATAAAVAAVAPPLTASLPSRGLPPQGPRSKRPQPLRPPTRSSPRKKACADGLLLPFHRAPSNGIPNTFRSRPSGPVQESKYQFLWPFSMILLIENGILILIAIK